MIGVHVDDSTGIGNDKFMKQSIMTSRKFESRERVYDNITLAKIRIGKKAKSYFFHQKIFATRPKDLFVDCTFDLFSASRPKIA